MREARLKEIKQEIFNSKKLKVRTHLRVGYNDMCPHYLSSINLIGFDLRHIFMLELFIKNDMFMNFLSLTIAKHFFSLLLHDVYLQYV